MDIVLCTHNVINLKNLCKLGIISHDLLMFKLRLGGHDDFLEFTSIMMEESSFEFNLFNS